MSRRTGTKTNPRSSPNTNAADRPAPRGLGQRQMRAMNWVALGILAIGVLGCVALLGTVPFLGYAPENPYADASTYFLIPGLLLPLAIVLLTGSLPAMWFSKAGEWQAPQTASDGAVKIAGTAAMGALALAVTMGSATPLLAIPAVAEAVSESVGYFVIGLVLFSLVLSAIVGAIVLGGWRAGIIGLVFGAGFVALVFGDVNGDRTLITAGIVALALSGAGFFLMGVISERLPLGHLETYNQPLAVVASVIVAAVGFVTGEALLILAGAMGVAAFIGIRIALRLHRR